MLQSKDINKIAELKNGFTPKWLEPDFIFGPVQMPESYETKRVQL